jgi:hypothetical protein
MRAWIVPEKNRRRPFLQEARDVMDELGWNDQRVGTYECPSKTSPLIVKGKVPYTNLETVYSIPPLVYEFTLIILF